MSNFLKKLFRRVRPASPVTTPLKPIVKGTISTNPPPTKPAAAPEPDVSQISDRQTLLTLTTSSKHHATKMAALAKLSDEADLQLVAHESKGRDNGVYQEAKARLKVLRQEQAEQQARTERVKAAVDALAALAATDNMHMYEAKTRALYEQWKGVTHDADAATQAEGLALLQRCQARADAIAAEHQAERDKIEQDASQLREREDTLATLKDALDSLSLRAPTVSDIPALDGLLRTQETRWLEATRNAHVERSEQKQYTTLMTELRHVAQCVHQLEKADALIASAQDAEGDGQENSEAQMSAFVKELKWPENIPCPDVINTIYQRIGRNAEKRRQRTTNQTKTREELEAGLKKLDQHLDDKQLKESTQTLREVQRALSHLEGRQAESYHGRLQLLTLRVQELKDWQGFAARPKQEELCVAMEHLAEHHLEPLAKAERIRELQQEWRELGGSSDQAVWQRFKAAADLAYEPCKEFFAAQTNLKQANVERRKRLCDELDELISKIDWANCDWKGLEKIDRVARQEWREAFPVDFKDNRAIQKRFDALLEELENHLEAEKARNLEKKQVIVNRAQALVAHEPINDAINQAKDLQREWQAIGLTDHREDRKLWKALRTACDAIFSRRDEQRQAHQVQRTEAHAKASEFAQRLDTIEATAATEGANDTRATLSACKTELNTAEGLEHADRERLNKQISRIEDALRHHAERHARAAKLTHWKTLLNTIDDSLTLANDAATARIEQLLSDAAHDTAPLKDALKQWVAVRRKTADLISESDFEDNAKALCVRLEIALGLESPDSDKVLRLQLQVSRLSEGFAQGRAQKTKNELIDDLLAEWVQLTANHQAAATHWTRRLHHALEAHGG